MTKISIQGQLASYSHIAASEIFGKEVGLLTRDSFKEVFDDLKSSRADFIVVPIENSTYGSIYQNYDNLTEYGFDIIGEIYLKINFHLIVNPGTKFEDIKRMYVHPVALGQIQKFVKENPQIEFIEHEDTAGAIKMIKEESMLDAAGAASRFASEFYEMEILEENIHENPKNYTRFYILSNTISNFQLPKEKLKTENLKLKTTLQFQLGEEAGSLYKSLRCFADRDIALTKIESRPVMNTDWEYRFYVDVMAGAEEERMKNSLKELQDYVHEFKILGSYTKGTNVIT